MSESKYKILVDYGGYEGMKWMNDTEYDSIKQAVKEALEFNSAFPFLIVKVINWEAKEV